MCLLIDSKGMKYKRKRNWLQKRCFWRRASV